MATPILTVAVAVYNDFDGLYFTLQSLRAHHAGVPLEVVVLDNAPQRCVRSEAVTRAVGGRYYHRPDLTGTSKSRDAAIRLARTPWVLCCDSHVLFESSALFSLENYCRTAEPNQIVSGPMIADDGQVAGTHWTRAYPNALWGTWGVDPRGRDSGNAAFDIDMNGLGAFCVHVAHWPGFHPLNRGFGGEEGVVHELYRQRAGKSVCLPALRWRHRFRDVGGWALNPTPYPLSGEDHVWNLLVGHRALGLDAVEQIQKDFKGHTHFARHRELADEAARLPLGQWPRPAVGDRLAVLGVWYSDNTAPPHLLQRSLASVHAAWEQSNALGGDVTVATCAWEPVPLNPFPFERFSGERKRSHATIVAQVRQAVGRYAFGPYDIVCFLEHDVLYPPDYFDRVEAAFRANPAAPVVSNLDYIGLSADGWQPVKERHEPMHQLAMRADVAEANLVRAAAECAAQGWAFLEPPGDRSDWVRLQPAPGLGMMPSVHVNHTKGRFTSHGDVCYGAATSKRHPHWGEHASYWPEPIVNSCGSCGPQAPPQFETLDAWRGAARTGPSDFNEHVETLAGYAAKCESAAEIVKWGKPSLVALAAGCPGPVLSLAPDQPAPLMQWGRMSTLAGTRFKYAYGPAAAEMLKSGGLTVDLLFVDTDHRADTVYEQFRAHAPNVAKYLVVHCTETFGHTGDDGGPGVLYGVRRFLKEHPEWVAVRRDKNNHGLVVLSRLEEDRVKPPGLLRKALNYSKALVQHAKTGQKLVTDFTFEERTGECLMCPHRVMDACGVCGCPIEAKASWADQSCPLPEPKWLTVL